MIKNLLAVALLITSFNAFAATSPVEILNWYKNKNVNLGLPEICKIIQKDVLERKRSFFTRSPNGWSVDESEAAYVHCEAENRELLNAKRLLEETKKAEILEQKTQALKRKTLPRKYDAKIYSRLAPNDEDVIRKAEIVITDEPCNNENLTPQKKQETRK